jgi:hypothetical protein
VIDLIGLSFPQTSGWPPRHWPHVLRLSFLRFLRFL